MCTRKLRALFNIIIPIVKFLKDRDDDMREGICKLFSLVYALTEKLCDFRSQTRTVEGKNK